MGAWLVYCMITNTYLLNPQLELLSTKRMRLLQISPLLQNLEHYEY